MRPLLVSAAVLAATGLLLPVAGAHAAGTVAKGAGPDYLYTGDGTANHLLIRVHAIPIVNGQRYEVVFEATSGDTVTSSADGCTPNPGSTLVICKSSDDIDSLKADGNGGGDELRFDEGQAVIFPPRPECFDCVSRAVTFDGGSGNDTLDGSAAGDSLFGGTGNDTIVGGLGQDGLHGEEDSDTLTGGPENDSVLDGGAGVDRARYDESGRVGGVTVDLTDDGPSTSDGGPLETTEDAVDIERVTGTAAADEITGGPEANVLNGGGGDDRLAGGNGGDSLTGDAGGDRLDGGLGSDAIDGGTGTDTGDYSSRTEAVTVTIAADGVRNDGSDEDGAPGARDTVANVERLLGGAGGDTLRSSQGVAVAFLGNDGDDLLVGTPADDTLTGGRGADTIDGAAGRDTATYDEAARAEGVQVTLGSGAGDDGSAFDANFIGTRDTVGNVEIVAGSPFADTLVGDGTANELRGGGGDDVLRGAGGADALAGGAGIDTASYEERSAGVAVTLDGAANDGAAGEADLVGADVESVRGGAGPDALVGNDGANVLAGGDGDDAITGAGGVDAFAAGPGNDSVAAIDGAAEPVDCGEGAADSVQADPSDQLTSCEVVAIGAPLIDADGDGFPSGQDCDDGNAAVHQGALEIPGNQVDEDCVGGPAAFQKIGASLSVFLRGRGDRFRFTQVAVRDIPAGAKVKLRCTPPKRGRQGVACPFKRFSRTFTAPVRKLDLLRKFKRRRFPAGFVFRLQVTHPLAIGKVRIVRMRGDKLPTIRQLCLVPGASRPARCG